ncbi:phosphatase PAP2 family protein [Actinoplanes sp. NPDC026619]|uniref:phosphatase PAP2 family protein n=1 Tax=Actinoplanes sp. NPDC026619 TaxID=3155798 RepID=UPI0033CEDFD2
MKQTRLHLPAWWTGRSPARRAIREVAFVAVLFLAYKLGRLLVEGHVGESFANAQTVWDFERLIHLPSEASLQAAVVGHTWLIRAANCFYAYVHFPATAAALIWLYLRRPEIYLWFRRSLASLTALALVTHALFPLAPPRMLAIAGLIDTGKVYGPSVYGSPTTDTLSNQYAAMPSLHVGWALAVAIALIAASRSRWRWLWLAHPITTLLVVVVTGNHYWLDAIAAVALLSLVLAVITPLSSATAAATPPVPAPRAPSRPAPVPEPVLALAGHPLLSPCAQLAVLVPGASLTAFLPELLDRPPAPAIPRQRAIPVETSPALSARILRSTPRPAEPDCVPSKRLEGEALSRPPASPATNRPGPSAPRSRTAPHR